MAEVARTRTMMTTSCPSRSWAHLGRSLDHPLRAQMAGSRATERGKEGLPTRRVVQED